MKLDDLKNFDINEFQELEKEDLDSLPYGVYKWNCCCKGCKNGTTVRDYGLGPFYFLNRNSAATKLHPASYWVNLDNLIWYCGKHWKYFKRLGHETMELKFIDPEKPRIGDFVKNVNQGNEKLIYHEK